MSNGTVGVVPQVPVAGFTKILWGYVGVTSRERERERERYRRRRRRERERERYIYIYVYIMYACERNCV